MRIRARDAGNVAIVPAPENTLPATTLFIEVLRQ
jgi:hypothetical protein